MLHKRNFQLYLKYNAGLYTYKNVGTKTSMQRFSFSLDLLHYLATIFISLERRYISKQQLF